MGKPSIRGMGTSMPSGGRWMRNEWVEQPAVVRQERIAKRQAAAGRIELIVGGLPDRRGGAYPARRMVHYFKFRQELFDPQPAKEVYVKPGPGKGWPEECPPIRAANAFGFDLLANFDVTFVRTRGERWRVERDVVIESDFDYAANQDAQGKPLTQQYAWFWQKGQRLP